MNHELKKAIETICKDRGLDKDMLVDTLEEAVRISVLRRFSDDMDIEVNYKEETGDIEVYQFKVVVEDDDVSNPEREIALADAMRHDPNVQLDDEVGFRVKVEDLGRIAAQSAKQVIIQRMRDAEQEIIYEEYKDRVGEIVSGIVQRRDKGGWVVNLGRTEAILPREEQIPREHFKRGDRVQAIIISVRKEGRGPQVVISRAGESYMTALFKREVPEVDDGVVQIMSVARDPGSRAKVAVLSRERDVDPVGACVGVRGSRIQNIVQELHGERIDIVVWSTEIATYARNALAPALVLRIVVDDDERLLEVIVPDDQLTNAIGRKGQNVKLAATLLGWKIDIYTETRYSEANAIGRGLEQLASVIEVPLETLLDAGYTSLASLQEAGDEELSQKLGIAPARITDLRAAISFLAPNIQTDAAPEGAPETAKAEGESAKAPKETPAEDAPATEGDAPREVPGEGGTHGE
ncbi:MAG: transcription termination factor NusA [Desulfovibrio sp.]|jgi:N utilization substance protein A|nr:transcription termination factor NusA [Desulfovibrio sp.]